MPAYRVKFRHRHRYTFEVTIMASGPTAAEKAGWRTLSEKLAMTPQDCKAWALEKLSLDTGEDTTS